MNITALKAFEDNYIWLLEDQGHLLLVDPGEAEPVLSYIEESGQTLDGVVLTHEHDDHVGGVPALLEEYPYLFVYGPVETNAVNTMTLEEGDGFEWRGHRFEVLKTAGHTQDHISYLVEGHLFCGDALFSAGCGRVFTGDYDAQFETMRTYADLDDDVLVYPGHEYTLSNLEFAAVQEPDNQDIQDALIEVKQLREKGQNTLSSSIGREKKINLFLQAQSLEEFIELREAKDQF